MFSSIKSQMKSLGHDIVSNLQDPTISAGETYKRIGISILKGGVDIGKTVVKENIVAKKVICSENDGTLERAAKKVNQLKIKDVVIGTAFVACIPCAFLPQPLGITALGLMPVLLMQGSKLDDEKWILENYPEAVSSSEVRQIALAALKVKKQKELEEECKKEKARREANDSEPDASISDYSYCPDCH